MVQCTDLKTTDFFIEHRCPNLKVENLKKNLSLTYIVALEQLQTETELVLGTISPKYCNIITAKFHQYLVTAAIQNEKVPNKSDFLNVKLGNILADLPVRYFVQLFGLGKGICDVKS